MKMNAAELIKIMRKEKNNRKSGKNKNRETDMGFNLPILEINGKHITLQCGCWDCFAKRKEKTRKIV